MVRLSANVVVPSGDGTLVDGVTDQDHFKGPRDARVTLVEYSDFQCPACKAFQPVIEQALKEPNLLNKVRFVYRSFPLSNIHPNATLAAQAAEAAARQGKFWEMHDALFEFQSSWSGLSNKGAREAFIGYATTIGLDVAAFSSDIDSDTSKNAVREQAATGTRAGVNSTPTFYINGTKMPQPRSYEEFRQFITDAVNANP
jgi:protein-disulfide isomerase